MYPAKDAHELAILLHTARDLDIFGDMTATVAGPSELLTWALILSRPEVVAWRSRDFGRRYLHVTAGRNRAPRCGQVTAVLDCEQHRDFWRAIGLDDLTHGARRNLGTAALSADCHLAPLTPPDTGQAAPPEPPVADRDADETPRRAGG